MHMIYMYLYKRYVGGSDMCICCIVSVQKPVPLHLAFASARLVALRRLVAGRALDFAEEVGCLCTYRRCDSSYCNFEDHLWQIGPTVGANHSLVITMRSTIVTRNAPRCTNKIFGKYVSDSGSKS